MCIRTWTIRPHLHRNVFDETVTFLCICNFRLHKNGENVIETFLFENAIQSENIRKQDEQNV